MKISGQQYSMMYGPTVGDKVRLADTDLIIEVEKDYTVYGDDVNSVVVKHYVTVWDNLLTQQVLQVT